MSGFLGFVQETVAEIVKINARITSLFSLRTTDELSNRYCKKAPISFPGSSLPLIRAAGQGEGRLERD